MRGHGDDEQTLAEQERIIDDLQVDNEICQKRVPREIRQIFGSATGSCKKGEGLAATNCEISDLHQRLVKQSDLLSDTMRSYAEKKNRNSKMHVLANRQKIIDNL